MMAANRHGGGGVGCYAYTFCRYDEPVVHSVGIVQVKNPEKEQRETSLRLERQSGLKSDGTQRACQSINTSRQSTSNHDRSIETVCVSVRARAYVHVSVCVWIFILDAMQFVFVVLALQYNAVLELKRVSALSSAGLVVTNVPCYNYMVQERRGNGRTQASCLMI